MGKSVPTIDTVKKSAMNGGVDGATLVAGEVAGRAVAGQGVGTILGGIVAAATESGEARDRMATIAIERGANELLGGN